MILIDSREKDGKTQRPMEELFSGTGVEVETVTLESGDYAFEGNGPEGPLWIGVERKRLSDLINSCFNGRIADLQAPRMVEEYDRRYLMVEGKISIDWARKTIQRFVYEPGRSDGKKGSWKDWDLAGRTVTLPTVRRFLYDFQEFFGMTTMFTDSPKNTVEELVTLHNWWSTPWDKHSGVKQFWKPVMTQGRKVSLTSARPKKVARFASELPDVGWEMANLLATEFETIEELVLASEDRLTEVRGIGKKSASRIWNWFREEEDEE